MSVNEYKQLTETEKLFIRKEHEKKFINSLSWIRNAVINAITNTKRKKAAKFIDLFPRKPQRIDKEYNKHSLDVIEKIEAKKGKSWVQKIFQANNGKKKGG